VLVNAVRSVRFGVTTIDTQVLRAMQPLVLGSTRGLPDRCLTLQIMRCIQINKTTDWPKLPGSGTPERLPGKIHHLPSARQFHFVRVFSRWQQEIALVVRST